MLPGSTVDDKRDFLRTMSLAALAASAADCASMAFAHTAVRTCTVWYVPCTQGGREGGREAGREKGREKGRDGGRDGEREEERERWQDCWF